MWKLKKRPQIIWMKILRLTEKFHNKENIDDFSAKDKSKLFSKKGNNTEWNTFFEKLWIIKLHKKNPMHIISCPNKNKP